MDILARYWSAEALAINALIVLNLIGAAGAGILIGYERSYHGRAAGMRTYALVCMASSALIVACGYPAHWFGSIVAHPVAADPTRVIQGIVTGIGFLGAGVIMKEGLSIRGLSTSASVWMTAAIGILIGLGFYAAAILATIATTILMSRFRAIERALPHLAVDLLTVTFARDRAPTHAVLKQRLEAEGFQVDEWAYSFDAITGQMTYTLSLQSRYGTSKETLVAGLSRDESVIAFAMTPSRS